MKRDHQIIWQKWVDPFGLDNDEAKWNNYDDDTPEDIQDYISEITSNNNSIKVIASPLGIIPYNENTASSKIFNFWVGHTSFSITPDIVKILETTNGVETLDVFTRYRFRIAIGKCFKDSDVMQDIDQSTKKYFYENRQ
jgi:hypothetical protein